MLGTEGREMMTAPTQMSIAPMPMTMDSISLVCPLAVPLSRASESSRRHHRIGAELSLTKAGFICSGG
jgi:hypothetical protein